MIYNNTGQLRNWLIQAGRADLANYQTFDLLADQFQEHLTKVASRPLSERQDAAAFRCLTYHGRPQRVESKPVRDADLKQLLAALFVLEVIQLIIALAK